MSGSGQELRLVQFLTAQGHMDSLAETACNVVRSEDHRSPVMWAVNSPPSTRKPVISTAPDVVLKTLVEANSRERSRASDLENLVFGLVARGIHVQG